MGKTISVALMCLLALTACGKKEPHFWYPIKLKYANCTTFKGDVYLMTNSVGWRSWPYHLDLADKTEIELPADCTIKTIRELPKHKKPVIPKLTDEQKEYRIDGF
ncbi:MAG: hypothetical protein GY954_09725 [Alteromonas sp.]|nr:hypothetical protein [Alteromonas sp.]